MRIRYFLVVAEFLNFTKAANALYISQPSLSKQIAILEDELGVLLFDRSKKVLQLTPAGALLNTEMQRVMPEFNKVIEKVRQADDACSTLSIACLETINIGSITRETLRIFTEQTKGVRLIMERCNMSELHQKIIDGSVDLALTISQQINKIKNITYVELEKRELYIVLAKHHELAYSKRIGIGDLKNQVFFLMDKSNALFTNDSILEECQRIGFTPHIRYCPNTETILDYVELGAGVAFYDKSIVENRKEKFKCFSMPNTSQFSLVCAWRINNNNPKLKEFIELLSKMVEAT